MGRQQWIEISSSSSNNVIVQSFRQPSGNHQHEPNTSTGSCTDGCGSNPLEQAPASQPLLETRTCAATSAAEVPTQQHNRHVIYNIILSADKLHICVGWLPACLVHQIPIHNSTAPRVRETAVELRELKDRRDLWRRRLIQRGGGDLIFLSNATTTLAVKNIQSGTDPMGDCSNGVCAIVNLDCV